MGRSGQGRVFVKVKPEDLQSAIRQQEERARSQAFDTEVATDLGSLVSEYNQRDTKAVSNALDDILRALERDIEGSIRPTFGGSVRKHTYVDGISDVDALLTLSDPKLQTMSPQEVLDYFERRLQDSLQGWEVSKGTIAITLTKGDLRIQILPAIKKDAETRIPSAKGDKWAEINPNAFFEQLSRANDRASNRLVPVIKAVKLVNAREPETLQLSGYHIESLAIEAFKGYSGTYNPKAMLEHFYNRAQDLVLGPIKDRTGQSVHVDEYLGAANSAARKAVAAALGRTYRRMKNADAIQSKQQWMEIFTEE